MLAPAGFIALRPFHDTGVSTLFVDIETWLASNSRFRV
jgi:hypothetical protein